MLGGRQIAEIHAEYRTDDRRGQQYNRGHRKDFENVVLVNVDQAQRFTCARVRQPID